jgi:cell division septation protein DedD
MDNAMVKRGIGAIVLAIIAALLLGYLLKDKSRERQEVVDMKLPGAPEINIPSLSEVTDKVSDSAASLVEETKDKVKQGGSAVIASASGTFDNLTENASESVKKVTDAVTSAGTSASTSPSNPNPGFSFRPPSQNEQKEISKTVSNNPKSPSSGSASSNTSNTNNTVVASSSSTAPSPKPAKSFKPVIEKEPVKTIRKTVKKQPESTQAATPAVATNKNGKYSIQLLATSSQSRANKLAKTMTGEGYVAFITQTTSNNKILYRVRVGGHNDRAAAIKAQENMKKRYQKNFFVQNSLVISN